MRLNAKVLRVLALLATGVLSAQTHEEGQPARPLPAYNILAGRPRKDLAAATMAAATFQNAALVRPGRGVLLDEYLGVPTFLWANAAAANGHPAKISAQFALAGSRIEESVAREHLNRFASLYALTSKDVAAASVASVHNTGKGAIIVKLRQHVGDVEVFRDEVNVVMNRNLDLVAISGHIPAATVASLASAAAMASPTFTLQAPEVLSLALQDLTGVTMFSTAFDLTSSQGPYQNYRIQPALAQGVSIRMQTPARVKPVYFNLPEGLQAAYYIELDTLDLDTREARTYGYVLSAMDGSLFFRKNLTAQDGFTYRVWADAQNIPLPGPNDPANYLPSLTGSPNSVFPNEIAPRLVALASGPISTIDPWLAPGATVTNGNNVDAYVDLDATDGLTGTDFRGSVSAPDVFGYTYNMALAPGADTAQQNASITQLFYTTNYLHDWFYDAGFDEASGNAQTDNYGRGGVPGDNLHAEAQDFGGINNANMTTPADGSHPRMQMYVWAGPKPDHSLTLTPGGSYSNGTCDFGPQTYNVTADVVLANDGTNPPTNGCEPIGNNVSGKIVLIDRGTCTFTTKVLNAQKAGAVGVIVVNNVTGVQNMAWDPLATTPITIPALMVSLADGNAIKVALADTVTATLSQTSENLDGSLDGQIVAHEWGHYISNRLIGNGAGLGTNQSHGLGEGWGDFHALLLGIQDGAVNLDGTFSVGAYATRGIVPSSNSYYFGIRRYPYSTDITKNALTFKHITTGVALPTGMPMNPAVADNAEVHNTGEVWASMLWEAYAALLKDTQVASPRLTFAQAQDRMKRYLVAAYKVTPDDPTFIEARDALLSVATAEDATDAQLFFQAFAKRGAGVGAVAPTDRYGLTNAGLVESFTTGGALAFQGATLAEAALSDGVVSTGETGILSVTLKNLGSADLSHTTATITNSDVSFPAGNQVIFPASTPFTTVTGTVPFVLTASTALASTVFNISYTDTELAVAGPLTASASFRVNRLDVPATSTTDDFSSSTSPWTPTGTPAWEYVTDPPTTHHWQGPDAGAPSDISLVSPRLQVSTTDPLTISLSHAYSFETSGGTNWDGGVIEVSTNDGSTWVDISTLGIAGYTGTLINTSGNPLGGRLAFANANAAYPASVPLSLAFGTSLAGQQQVRIRFRIGTDAATGGPGWTIRSIAIAGITNTPFPTVTPTLSHGTTTTLTSSGPSHSGDTVTFTATVTSPAGTLTGNMTFLDGATLLGTVALTGNSASYTTSTLSVGSHAITAAYQGSLSYPSSASAVLSQTVNLTALSLVSSVRTLATSVGRPVSFHLAVNTAGTLTGPITFTSAGLPPGAQIEFSPASIAPGSLPADVTVTITPALAGNPVASSIPPKPANGAWGLTVFMSGLVVIPAARRRRRRQLGVAIAVLGSTLLLLMACHQGGATASAPGSGSTSTVTITAVSSGAAQGSVDVVLNVAP